MMTSIKLLLGLYVYLGYSLTIADQNIVSRADWGAQDVNGEIDNLKTPVDMVIIGHTATEACNDRPSCEQKVQQIQAFHMESKSFSDIGYSFLIGNDGNVYEGRGWTKVGAHTRGYNVRSIGVCFIGTFNKQLPSEAALNAAQELVAEGVRLGKISANYKLFGQIQLAGTESPGQALYLIIKKWPHWSTEL